MMLLSVLRTLGVHYEDHTTEFLVGALDLVIETCDSAWEPWHFRAAFRLVTFEALSLRHTCNGVVNHGSTEHITESASAIQVERVFGEVVEWSNDMVSDYFSVSRVDVSQQSQTSKSDAHGRLEGVDEGGPPSSVSGAAGVPDTVWKSWLKRWTQRSKMESLTGTQMDVSLHAAEITSGV